MSPVAQRYGAGDGHAAGMADAQPPTGDAEISRGEGGSSVQNNFRRPAGSASNHDILERYAGAETCAESLQHRFLGGEPAGQPFDPLRPISDLGDLLGGEAARKEGIARIFDPSAQRCDLDEINSMSEYDHLQSPLGSPSSETGPPEGGWT